MTQLQNPWIHIQSQKYKSCPGVNLWTTRARACVGACVCDWGKDRDLLSEDEFGDGDDSLEAITDQPCPRL